MQVKREVRIEAYDRRYQGGHNFYAIPYHDASVNNYITGQEKRPGRKNGLTKEQIEGTVKVTDKQREEFPYLITFTPNFRGEAIYKGMTLDLSKGTDGNPVNNHDFAIYNMLVEGQDSIIAASRSDCKSGKHIFYFVDKVKDAEKRVLSKRDYIDAIKLVSKNLEKSSYYELLIFINHLHNTIYSPNERDEYILEDSVNEICEKYTASVVLFFKESSQQILFILKLLHYGILTFQDGAIVDSNGKYIASDAKGVLEFSKKKGNSIRMVHWRAALTKVDAIFAKEEDEKKNTDK